jgi:16S rRNA (guanine527-N7)-methyltransferase
LNAHDRQLLVEGARRFGVDLTEDQLSLFALFIQGLWEWNRRVNLTGISEKRDMIGKLLLDPLVALPYLPEEGRLLDVGSGAGIPGVPLKVARQEFEVHLLESKAKKVSFLREIIRRLGLEGINAYQGRAEKGASLTTSHSTYDIVTARALASLNKTIGICSPFIEPGGLLVAFKGSRVDREIEESEAIIRDRGLSMSNKVFYTLPGFKGRRCLVILQKGK